MSRWLVGRALTKVEIKVGLTCSMHLFDQKNPLQKYEKSPVRNPKIKIKMVGRTSTKIEIKVGFASGHLLLALIRTEKIA